MSGDTIVIGDVGGAVIALDARDGSEMWRHSTGGAYVYSTPGDRRRRRLHRLLQRQLPGPRPRRRGAEAGRSTWAAAISGSATVVDGVVYTARLYAPGPGPPHLRPRHGHRRRALRDRRRPLLAGRGRRAHALPRGHAAPLCPPCARAVGASGSASPGSSPLLLIAGGRARARPGARLVRRGQHRGDDRGLRARPGPARRRGGGVVAGVRLRPRAHAGQPGARPAAALPPGVVLRRRLAAGVPAGARRRARGGGHERRPRDRDRPRHRPAGCGASGCAGASPRRRPSPATSPCSPRSAATSSPCARRPARQVWRRRVGSAVESSPLVVGDAAYVGTLAGRVLSLDVRTGGVRWSARGRRRREVQPGARRAERRRRRLRRARHGLPALRRARRLAAREPRRGPEGGRALLRRARGGLRARLPRQRERARHRARRATPARSPGCGCSTTTSTRAPAVSEQTVFVGSYDHQLHALDAVTGRAALELRRGRAHLRLAVGDRRRRLRVHARARPRATGAPSPSTSAPGGGSGPSPTAATARRWPFEGLLVLTGVRTLYGLVPR